MSDSVGKITLDLELKSDLESQINKISQQIGEKLKSSVNQATQGMFDGMNKNMDKSMQNMTDTLKSNLGKMKDSVKSSFSNIFSAAKNIKVPTGKKPSNENEETPITTTTKSIPVTRPPPKFDVEVAKAQMETLQRTLDITNNKIENQREKLARLKEQQEQAFNITRKNKLAEEILRTEGVIESLIAKSDKYGFKLADLDAKLEAFAAAQRQAAESSTMLDEKIEKTGMVAQETGSKISRLSMLTRAFTSGMNSSFGAMKKFGNQFSDLGSKIKGCDKHTRNYHYGLGMLLKQFFTWMIIFPALMRAINYLTLGLWNNLKTNEQFNNSLEQIKTNLMVAFTPIYQAILPAINAFMSALATLTTYIASFFSVIFGKTYQQSYQATQGLIDAKEAMGAYGDAAKKTAKELGGLVGIDEINNLTKSDAGAADNSKVPKLTQPSLDTSETDAKMKALADKIKKMFANIFAPMKQAWDKEGKNTLNAAKYALDNILRVLKDIGKSFYDVWTNGTGEKLCENILKLLQTIFGIIGDIAKAFAIAWETGNLGTKLIQAMFDSLNFILELLITIGKTFREVWNSGVGVEICTNILEILKNIFTIIGQIAKSFKNAWDSGLGKQLITDILNLLNGCLRIIKNITSSFSKAWESKGDTVCEAILLILDDIIGTISDIANKWSNAWEQDGNGNELMQSLLSLLGKILNLVGDVGKGIRESIGKAADTIFPTLIKFMKDVSDSVGNVIDGIKEIWDDGGKYLFDGIVQLIAQIADLLLKMDGPIFKDFSNYFKEVLAPNIAFAIDKVALLIKGIETLTEWMNKSPTAVTAFRDTLYDLALSTIPAVQSAVAMSKIFKPITQDLDEIKEKISTTWENIKTSLSQKLQEIKTNTSTKFGEIKTDIGEWWDKTKEDTSTKWESIKTTLFNKWNEIKINSSTTWDNIKQYIFDKWNEINTAAPNTWDTIKNTLSGKWNEISATSQGVWNGIVDFLNTTFSSNWSGAWNNLRNIVANAFSGLENIVKKPINAIIDMANRLIDGLNSISIDIPNSDIFGDFAGESFGINIPNIPKLATGGVIDSPTLAMVGEAGKEAVMPLENNTGWITELASKIASLIGVNSNSVSTSPNDSGDLIIMIDGDVIGKVALAQLRKMQRQGSITLMPV